MNYALDYNFDILYCPNIHSPTTTKIYIPQTGEFTSIKDGKSRWFNSFKIKTEDVQHIIFLSKSHQLAFEPLEEDDIWLQEHKKLYEINSGILKNKDITFNMFILKLIILGFSEEFSRKYIQHYYELSETNSQYKIDLPNVNELYKTIELKLLKKKFWIPNDLNKEKKIEIDFFKKIFKKKQELGYEFNFESMYKEQYMSIISNSFIPKLVRKNQTTSFWVTNPIPLSYQIPYLLDTYELITDVLLKETYKVCPVNNIFFENIPRELKECVSEYLSKLLKQQNTNN